MKIRADEHVSPEIVETVCRVAASPECAFDHVYDANDAGSADEHWITRFAKAGGDAILSADRDFTSKHPQIRAVFATGLKVIQLPGQWGRAEGHLQAAHVLLWWPRIERQIAEMRKRECYKPEWNVSGETGKFRKVEIDFQAADRKAKRDAKRASR